MDKEIFDLIKEESIRQNEGIELIASENIVSEDILEVTGSIFTNKYAEGKPFKDIKGKDIDGNPTALSDYIGKGNYILLDMWASWCGPCIGEIPNLLKLLNKYKDKGLTVLGVFVSDKEENLKKAITNEGVVWPQIIDSEDKAMEIYGVNGIPHIILFAPDGTILKRDFRGQEIINTVSEILDKQ